jgi:signal transduction histidine kinase
VTVGSHLALEPRKGERVTPPESPPASDVGPELPPALSVASHDVAEAVRVVTGYAELLGAHAAAELDEQAQRYLTGIRDGLEHLDRLLHGVLTYVRASVEPLQLVDVELDLVLEEALRPLRGDLEHRRAGVVFADLPTVTADEGAVRELLRNLAHNALTFAGEEALVIEVGAERDGGAWRVHVRDNGIGLDPDARERVLEPFERGHPRSFATGPGLGLAIARRIVERHGGRLWLETGDTGTTALFTIPDPAPPS